jgi:hypothetical protein
MTIQVNYRTLWPDKQIEWPWNYYQSMTK